MTRSHFRLAGGPLSVMIYWFPSPVLQLDFSISHSLLLFYRHHRLERRWKDKQLQPAKLFKNKEQKCAGRRSPTLDWLLNRWCFMCEKEPFEKWFFSFVTRLCAATERFKQAFCNMFAKGQVQTNIWLADQNVPFFLDWQTFISTF